MDAELTRVLLIDHDDARVTRIRTQLADARPHTFHLSAVPCVERAIDAFPTGRPDVVLLSIVSHDASAQDELRLAVRTFGHVPIVALTPTNDDALALEAVRAGAEDALSVEKLRARELRRALRHAVARSRSHAALQDAVTSLPSRVRFADLLRQALARVRRHPDHRYAVLTLDVDRFGVVNESLGHDVGDRLLEGIARRFEACLRPEDTVARLGDDEFAVLLDGIGDAGDGIRVATRLQASLARPFVIGGRETFVSASIGIAIGVPDYTDPAEVLRDSSIAMYRAKSSGKARHAIFDRTMHAQAVALLTLETDLRHALRRGELELHYQPIVAFGTRSIAGLEALVRWRHPTRGLLSPRDFIPLAEETGLIVDLGRWVLEEACRQTRRWAETFPDSRGLTVNVNISGRQLADPGLACEVASILARTRLAPTRLRLEMTESVIMHNASCTQLTFKRLRDLGVRLAIDDFGTGYSSLSYLHRFPVDTLKIDRTFVGNLDGPRENLEIVRSIVSIANTLGLDVTAEGVETEAQVRLLTEADCHTGQGFLFHRPLPARDAMALLAGA